MADDACGRIKVAVRIRPPLEWEQKRRRGKKPTERAVWADGDADVYVRDFAGSFRQFSFDEVFDDQTSQVEVFARTAEPIIAGIFRGFNGAVLAYGQTGTGKSHTMGLLEPIPRSRAAVQTSVAATRPADGIVAQTLRAVFDRLYQVEADDWSVQLSFVEVFNDKVGDLLSLERRRRRRPATAGPRQRAGRSAAASAGDDLDLRTDGNGELHIVGSRRVEVFTYDEAAAEVNRGLRSRSQAATRSNLASSRSHVILTITVEQRSGRGAPVSPPWEGGGSVTHQHVVRGRLFLVDLAGSERVQAAVRNDEHMGELIHINSSLSALGKVIAQSNVAAAAEMAARRGARSRGRVPPVQYRDCKLTRLLQSALGGAANAAFIATLSPGDDALGETMSTLMFASRCLGVPTEPLRHEYTAVVKADPVRSPQSAHSTPGRVKRRRRRDSDASDDASTDADAEASFLGSPPSPEHTLPARTAQLERHARTPFVSTPYTHVHVHAYTPASNGAGAAAPPPSTSIHVQTDAVQFAERGTPIPSAPEWSPPGSVVRPSAAAAAPAAAGTPSLSAEEANRELQALRERVRLIEEGMANVGGGGSSGTLRDNSFTFFRPMLAPVGSPLRVQSSGGRALLPTVTSPIAADPTPTYAFPILRSSFAQYRRADVSAPPAPAGVAAAAAPRPLTPPRRTTALSALDAHGRRSSPSASIVSDMARLLESMTDSVRALNMRGTRAEAPPLTAARSAPAALAPPAAVAQPGRAPPAADAGSSAPPAPRTPPRSSSAASGARTSSSRRRKRGKHSPSRALVAAPTLAVATEPAGCGAPVLPLPFSEPTRPTVSSLSLRTSVGSDDVSTVAAPTAGAAREVVERDHAAIGAAAFDSALAEARAYRVRAFATALDAAT